MPKLDTLVFCGRFQPFHLGHAKVVEKALQEANQLVIVIGSAFQARSIKNPWTFEERRDMITKYLESKGISDRVSIVPVTDYPYDDNAWISAVQKAVERVSRGKNIGLIGHSKDSSSYYLKIFPQWKDHIEVENYKGIDATQIRKGIFGSIKNHSFMKDIVVSRWIAYWATENTGILRSLQDEYKFIEEYKYSWATSPFSPVFVTTDAVLTQSGHILLVKRGGYPYKDCWALPGGYLDPNHSVRSNMIKELREETRIKVPEKVLNGSMKRTKIFDMPDRDPRGRTITHAYHVDLGYPEEGLPKVKGADDAVEAQWFKLSDVQSDKMAFDHYHIIRHFIAA